MKEFAEVVKQLKQLPREEARKESLGYFEFVISVKNLCQLYPLLEAYLGPPFKPAGTIPSTEALDRASVYGGIEKQQTLYYRESEGVSNCAMIWPWNDHTRATVKMAQGKIKR